MAPVQLEHPLALLLLVPVLALTVWALRGSALGLGRRRFALSALARLLLIACLGGVLADVRLTLPSDERAVVFALDASESVGPAERRHLLEWARRAWAARRPGDAAGLVVFGGEARLESPLGPVFEPGEPDLAAAGLARERTALERALRLAGDLVRGGGAEPHVVLLSDGNGEAEPALREARALASAGVRLHTVAVDTAPAPGEVLVASVSAPPVVARGEPFLLAVEVLARSGGPAVLHVVRNGRYVGPQQVELAPGANHLSVPQRLDDADVYVYEVTLEAAGDGNPSNDAGGAIVRVRGKPRALVVLGGEEPGSGARPRTPAELGAPLAAALRAGGFEVDVHGPEGLPLGQEELAGYAALVFGDVPAERWTLEQMEATRRWVFEQGGGLIALGGERSFGQGGYWRTPVEEALPVSSDVRAKKVLPSLALIFCLDRSSSMDQAVGESNKLDLAKEGIARSVELLQPFDRVGVLAFAQAPDWVVRLVEVDDAAAIKARVRALQGGGGTELIPALDEARRTLRATDAEVRHVVLLTDGQSGEDPLELRAIADAMARDGITLSTVGLGKEVDQEALALLADRAEGRFLWTDDPQKVPRLLTQEAVTASRALLVERRFVPRHTGPLARLGIDWSAAPPLLGFVLTVPRPGAEVLLDTGPGEGAEDGPILVRWRYGLGRAVAFTSDATARWSAPWLGWPGYAEVLGGVVRWAARPPEAPGFGSELTVEEGRGEVRLDAEGPDGRPVNGLVARARLTGPPGVGLPSELPLTQVAPGDYRATFEAPRPGPYFVTIEAAAGGAPAQAVASAGAVLAYPREYRHLGADHALLARLAELGGGSAWSVDDPPDALLGAPRQRRVRLRPLGATLLALAAALLLVEVAARRLVLPERARRALERWRARRAARSAPGEAAATIDTLRARKREERQAAAAARSARVERAAISGRAPAATAAPPASAAPPPPPNPRPAPRPAEEDRPKPPAPPTPPAATDDPVARLLAAKRQARERRP